MIVLGFILSDLSLQAVFQTGKKFSGLCDTEDYNIKDN